MHRNASANPFKPAAGADSTALAALVEQLAVKDVQIAKLMDAVADSTKAGQGAQALHHETAQTVGDRVR